MQHQMTANGLGDSDGTVQTLYTVASAAGVAMGAYHGYKRNDSVGWAVAWALLGGVFPFVTIPVSLAQGFGEPEKG